MKSAPLIALLFATIGLSQASESEIVYVDRIESIDTNYEPISLLEVKEPDYPLIYREKGMSGQVLLEVVVDRQGFVRDVEILSSTYPQFGKAAKKAMYEWVFQPAKLEGIEIDQTVIIPIRFQISEDDAPRMLLTLVPVNQQKATPGKV